jgi:hypothetical protein
LDELETASDRIVRIEQIEGRNERNKRRSGGNSAHEEGLAVGDEDQCERAEERSEENVE